MSEERRYRFLNELETEILHELQEIRKAIWHIANHIDEYVAKE